MKLSKKVVTAVALLVSGVALASCATTDPVAKPAPAPASKPRPAAVRAEFPGFRRVLRQDTEYFCQSRSPTGSRARTGEQCFTRDEMKQMEENSRDFFKDAGGGSSHDSLKTDSPR